MGPLVTFPQRQATLFIYLWISTTTVYFVNRAQLPSRLRAWVCLFVSGLHLALLPLVTDSMNDPMSVMPITGILSFSAFKITALTMKRGVLPYVCQHYWQFVAACALPIIPESAFHASRASKCTTAGSQRNSTRDQLRSLVSRATCGVIATAAAHELVMPRLALCWLYILILNMFLGAVTDCFAVVTTVVLGMRLAPCFDRPYCSATIAEFWSQRWNVTTTYLFRVMIYDPIVEGRLMATTRGHAPAAATTATAAAGAVVAVDKHQEPKRSVGGDGHSRCADHGDVSGSSGSRDGTARFCCSTARRLTGIQATFAVSAAWHVLLYWLLTGNITWHWPVFFLIQAPIVAVERIVRKVLKQACVTVPRPVAILSTNMLLIALADSLLISPLVDSGVVGRMFGQAAELAQQLKQLLSFGFIGERELTGMDVCVF